MADPLHATLPSLASLQGLFAPLSSLPGLGAKRTALFLRLLDGKGREPTLLDLLFHLPVSVIDRSNRPKIREILAQKRIGQTVTLAVTVSAHIPPRARFGTAPYKVLVEDGTGDVTLVFFNGKAEWLMANLPVGEQRYVSGTIALYDGHLQMEHPKIMGSAAFTRLPPFEPVYPLTEGLTQTIVQMAISNALSRVPALPDWLAPARGFGAYASVRALPGFVEALKGAHRPQTLEGARPDAPCRMRLALDELFAHHLALALSRTALRLEEGVARAATGALTHKLKAALPFALTGAQTLAIAEIAADMASTRRMVRLLQGDVGSGKTLVALFAMMQAIEASWQAAFMAPTEILARQHFGKLAPLCAALGLNLGLLTGRERARARLDTLEALKSGALHAVIGTHALFQDDVAFQRLGLVVVDEQHRFGVYQRLMLTQKGAGVDVLVMSATPIPRTLVLTYFGDMDVSFLREKPAGRQEIRTRVKPLSDLDAVIAALRRAVDDGAQVYWVCPLVAESEEVDATAAEERYEALVGHFGKDKVGLVHGRLRGDDKDRAMGAFASGKTRLLVATTAIEVGVDVPNASIIVIEHAERFGLAQLHQLRGRVGRGAKASSCLLLYQGPLSANARARLKILRETNDGFLIAEEDLRLRGFGEILGARQSGDAGFRLADIATQSDLVALARTMASHVLEQREVLSRDERAALAVLLKIFGHENAADLLQAG